MHTRHFTSLATVLGLLSTAFANAIPHAEIVPRVEPQDVLSIERQAGGKLSNAPPPTRLSAAGIVNFQLIAFNENVEVAFFDEIIKNITNRVPGYRYKLPSRNEGEILEILKTVKAQEQLHASTATGALRAFNAPVVPVPCKYNFPSTSLVSALELAELLTAVVLGTLQDASQAFAQNGDYGPVRAIASVIGQEGEQDGFYRYILNRMPSQKPFLTTSTAAFAWSVLQSFVVSCPFDVSKIPIPVFPALNVLTTAKARDMYLTFSAKVPYTPGEGTPLFVTYLVGLQNPVSEPIVNPRCEGGVLTFEALFPFTENVMYGLSIAALTNATGFADADAVVANTLAAPGLIQVNKMLRPAKPVFPALDGF
ncbi:hypothetical protein GGS20DRAFT_415539 [Poronia punctata]|nr:hypothetical protein GGS20DRAFT_415539 [Poronia punctata]